MINGPRRLSGNDKIKLLFAEDKIRPGQKSDLFLKQPGT